jgi:hypothetical protein
MDHGVEGISLVGKAEADELKGFFMITYLIPSCGL